MDHRDVAEASRCPIDFDHASPQHAHNWPENYRKLRESCPMVWSERHGGFWVATRYHDVVNIAQNHTNFTSGKTFNPETGESTGGTVIPPNPTPAAIPIESDMPQWRDYRRLLNRHFAPQAAEARRARARAIAANLIDQVIETGRIDFVNDLTSPLPAMLTMEVIGFPLKEAQRFANAMHEMIYTPNDDPEFSRVMMDVQWIFQRTGEEIQRYRREPADNLLSHLVHEKIDGQHLDDSVVSQIVFTILAGGVDTTTALTANTLLHLYQHPSKREHLLKHPEALPIAREEFVRYFSPIQALSRTAQADATVAGQEVHKGERVLIAYAAANRDPRIFNQPEELQLDRFPNRHIGFGAGMHRCLGSFLARVMFETMLNEVLTRVPDYVIDVGASRRYTSISPVNGWITMPATFTPGTRSTQTL